MRRNIRTAAAAEMSGEVIHDTTIGTNPRWYGKVSKGSCHTTAPGPPQTSEKPMIAPTALTKAAPHKRKPMIAPTALTKAAPNK